MSYLLDLFSGGECLNTVHTGRVEFLLPALQLDTEYSVSVCTVLGKRGQSKPVSKNFKRGREPDYTSQESVGLALELHVLLECLYPILFCNYDSRPTCIGWVPRKPFKVFTI